MLPDLQQSSVTDAGGTYIFRDLPAGNYVVVATYRGHEYTAAVSVPEGPALLRDIDVAVAPGDSTPILSESHPEPSRAGAIAIRSGAGSAGAPFAVQIAALRNASRARALVAELKRAGLPAYLIEPAVADPTAPYRVRIGGYASREEANAVAGALEKARGEKLWVTTER
jgi:cell division septation protein DedD